MKSCLGLKFSSREKSARGELKSRMSGPTELDFEELEDKEQLAVDLANLKTWFTNEFKASKQIAVWVVIQRTRPDRRKYLSSIGARATQIFKDNRMDWDAYEQNQLFLLDLLAGGDPKILASLNNAVEKTAEAIAILSGKISEVSPASTYFESSEGQDYLAKALTPYRDFQKGLDLRLTTLEKYIKDYRSSLKKQPQL